MIISNLKVKCHLKFFDTQSSKVQQWWDTTIEAQYLRSCYACLHVFAFVHFMTHYAFHPTELYDTVWHFRLSTTSRILKISQLGGADTADMVPSAWSQLVLVTMFCIRGRVSDSKIYSCLQHQAQDVASPQKCLSRLTSASPGTHHPAAINSEHRDTRIDHSRFFSQNDGEMLLTVKYLFCLFPLRDYWASWETYSSSQWKWDKKLVVKHKDSSEKF